MSEIRVYDTTLRDGAQSGGIKFSAEDKAAIVSRLESFGIDYIECGWPGSNPMDDEFFSKLGKLDLKRTKAASFGSTRRKDVEACEDENLEALANCEAGTCCIFGKSWEFQVTKALRTTREENLAMIRDSVGFLKKAGKEVVFDAEHFFDGYDDSREYALQCLDAAVKGGADWLVLCDTNGGSMPGFVKDAVADVALSFDVPIGIHTHDDCGLAVANAMAAVESGATMVQGTINGIGERCGNANLCTLMPNLQIKMGYDLGIDMSGLTALSRYVAEIENVDRPGNLPYVGDLAFTHKGGMHVSALARDNRTYEHIEPATVGNRTRILISDMSGRANISMKLEELGLNSADDSKSIVQRMKRMEAEGYDFEGADASFELLVRKMREELESYFKLINFRVFIDSIDAKLVLSEASVKVTDGKSVAHTAADGDGPVDALQKALAKALGEMFPVIKRIKLTDYKVRVLDSDKATAAPVRVLVTTACDGKSWTTVGVSENVIEASLYALTDSMEYAILKLGRD